MKENFDEDSEYMRELLNRFEKREAGDGYSFFDSSELEDIIYYYFNENILPKALEAIDFALENFPGEVSFQVLKAQYFLNNGEPEKALARLNKLETIDPLNPDIILTRAAAFSSLNRHGEAVKEYNKVLEMVDEDQEELHVQVSYEYQALGNFAMSVEHLKTAIGISPNNEGLLYEIGYTFEMGQMSEEAIKFFTNILDERPYSFVAWYNLGMSYSSLELYEKAIDAFDYCIAISPQYIPAYYSKAQCYEQMDMYQQAIGVYKQTFEYEKPDAMINFYMADCYNSLEKYETAIEYYRKAISMERHFPDAWLGIGICFAELGQHTEAISHIEQAIKLESDSAEYHLLLAESQQAMGLMEKAESSYQKASELEPYHADIWLDYADFYVEVHKDYKRALDIIEEGIYYHSENSALAYRRVAYLYESGMRKDAILELFIALTMDFPAHTQLLEYSEHIRNSTEILTAIESFKLHHEPPAIN